MNLNNTVTNFCSTCKYLLNVSKDMLSAYKRWFDKHFYIAISIAKYRVRIPLLVSFQKLFQGSQFKLVCVTPTPATSYFIALVITDLASFFFFHLTFLVSFSLWPSSHLRYWPQYFDNFTFLAMGFYWQTKICS